MHFLCFFLSHNVNSGHMRFIADRMLGKLCTWLRILGYDTVYAADLGTNSDENEDRVILSFAARESRILLTRDRVMTRLADREGIRYVLVRGDDVMEQLAEIIRYVPGVNLEPVPMRCSECNGELRKMVAGEEYVLRAKSYVPADRIGEMDFWICKTCGRVYWRGSHWRNMRMQLQRLKRP